MNITRRDFLRSSLATGAAAMVTPRQAAEGAAEVAQERVSPVGQLLGSAPVLLNPAERTIDVVFAVNGEASGWVEISKSPDMAKSVRVHSGEGPVMRVNDRFAVVRVKGLRPATRYWYRIGADRIELERGYKLWNRGSEPGGRIYSFTTLGAESGGAFCVINDTHNVKPVLDAVLAKMAQLSPSALIWNGDAANCVTTAAEAVDVYIRPHKAHPEWAATVPVLFLNGNHDFRGRFNLRLEELLPFRPVGERNMRYASLGRNFVQRIGDVALIGLDTGEDKQDTNPRMGGIFRMAQYRRLQTQWLAEAIESPAVTTARFKVAFCHIPLFDPRPDENPGDITPADDDPRYKHPWAAWQRTCANLWGPLFKKTGVQLVITGHQHCFRYDAPSADRPWAQIVGGGCDASQGRRGYPTVVEGRVENGALRVTVHDCGNKKIVFDKKFGG